MTTTNTITLDPTVEALFSPHNYRTIFKNNEIKSISSFERQRIRDACISDEHPTDVLEVSRELFDSGNDSVKRFFYHRRQNIDSRFKPLWKLRYDIQQLLGE
jgi:hypothetical protein